MMALIAVAGIFLSIILHEISHLLMARGFGLKGNKITLFMFGGVSDIENEPPSPKAEFWISVVGPLFSAVLGLTLAGVSAIGLVQEWPFPTTDVIYYLAGFNYIVSVFNLMPAFPLDGGRILRSALWAWKGDIEWATRIASNLGVGFGFFIAAFGVLQFLTGGLLNGVWLFFLGMFLVAMARASYTQVLLAKILARESVEHVMKPETAYVEPNQTIDSLVRAIFKHHSKVLPVVQGTNLVGCVGINEVRKFSEAEWPQHKVSEVISDCSGENLISPNAGVMQAFNILTKTKNDELIVADGGKVVGKISLKDILDFFTLKLEIERPAV